MPTPVENPHKQLACAILLKAVNDWKKLRHYQKPEFCRDIVSTRYQVIDFMQSNWFETLCDLAELDPLAVREHLKIPEQRVVVRSGKYMLEAH